MYLYIYILIFIYIYICIKTQTHTHTNMRVYVSRPGTAPQLVYDVHTRTEHQDSLAEWSKALAVGASPQGRGLEPHSCQCHNFINRVVFGGMSHRESAIVLDNLRVIMSTSAKIYTYKYMYLYIY